MTYWLRDDLANAWAGADAFDQAKAQEGTIYRAREGRRTLSFAVNGKRYFLKYHSGIGWKEIIKNLLQMRQPITSAMNEVVAIRKLTQAGIDTMTLAGFGKRGQNPAHIESFVITDALDNTLSLEDVTANWAFQPPLLAFKQGLLKQVVLMARQMHNAGINHRDFYLCHFLMDERAVNAQQLAPLHLIDLHRAQSRTQVPRRWQIKDIAGLFFSAMDAGLTRRDLLRAMAIYTNKAWRTTLEEDRRFWLAVLRRANKLYLKDHKRQAPKWF